MIYPFYFMKTISPTAPILIVDDDEDDRWLMGQAFKQACPQLKPMFAKDGEEAVDILQVLPLPILILTDLNMPRLNGAELVEQLRLHPFYRTIPIVICTTSISDDDRQRCYLAGANAFVTKPYQLADLTELARCLLTVWIKRVE